MTSVRKLEIRIDQTGDASRGIQGIAGSVGKIASVGLAAGAAAVGGVALLTVGVIKVGASLVALGSDAEEMESKFNVVFGMFAGGAKISLEQFGDAVGRNTYELMEMASSLQDTFVPLGFARGAATALSVEMTKLAVDMGSFNNVADADVMRDLQSAIVGNHETVRKYGIVITEATLGQELMRMGIEDGVKVATEQEKVQARLNLILAGTTDAQGDAERTAGSWANQMRALKAQISEGATAMGLELLPVVTPILQHFTALAKDIIPKAVEIFKEFAGNLGETIGPAMLLINDALKRIAEAFGMNTDEVSATDVILKVFKATLDVIVIAIKATALVMQGLATGIEYIRRRIDEIIGAWKRFKDAVRDAVNAIPAWLIPGSPTPFELGLRGIGSAMKGLDFGTMAVAGGTPAMGGGGVNIYLAYAPAISLGDRYEAEQILVPMIQNALRRTTQ